VAVSEDSVLIRFLLTGEGVFATKIRAMRGEILGLSKDVQRSNAAQLDSSIASSKAATGMMRFGSAAKWTAGIFGVGLAFGLVGVLHRATTFMSQQTVVMKQTEAQIKSTGASAGFTGEQIKKMAESLAATTGQDPLQLQSAANRMLGFTNVRGAIFQNAIKEANDVAVAMHTGPESAAKALGFALDNPATGMMRLMRLGVSLSAANKSYIKDLVARGQTEQAQVFILDTLHHKYGDSARMFGETLPGQLGKLKFAIDELLARELHPLTVGATALAGAFATVALWVLRNTWVLKPLGVVLGVVAAAVALWALHTGALLVKTAALWVWEQLSLVSTWAHALAYYAVTAAVWLYEFATLTLTGTLVAATTAVWAFTTALLANPITWIVVGVALLAVGLYLLYTRVTWFHKAVDDVFHFLRDHWALIGAILIAPFSMWIAAGILVVTHLQDIVSFVSSLPGRLAGAGAHMWDWLTRTFRHAMSAILDMWNASLGKIDLSWFGGPDLHVHNPFGSQSAHAAARTVPSVQSRPVVASVGGVTGPRAGMALAQHPDAIHTHVYLDTKEIATAVNEYNSTAGARR